LYTAKKLNNNWSLFRTGKGDGFTEKGMR